MLILILIIYTMLVTYTCNDNIINTIIVYMLLINIIIINTNIINIHIMIIFNANWNGNYLIYNYPSD